MSTEATSLLPTDGTWTIDPGHSSARFSVVHHSVATFTAAFHGIHGSYDGTTGRLTGSVDVDSIYLPDLPKLREHLLSADWFDVGRFPSLSFEADEVRPGGVVGQVPGRLTMKGVTQSIEVLAAFGGRAPVLHFADESISDHFGLDLSAVIDRRGFGLAFNNHLPDGTENLGWTVSLDVLLELVVENGASSA